MIETNGVRGVEAANAALERGAGAGELVVLPREMSSSGVALYDDSVIDVVKTLRAEGYEADFADDQDHRSWAGEKSAEVVLALVVGVGSNAAWASLVWLFRRFHIERRVEAKVARIVQSDTGTTWDWAEFKGTGAEVADLMEQHRARPSAD